MNDLDLLISKHLGRSADGVLNSPYVTPFEVDRSLLVAVPRQVNRSQYDLSGEMPFVGVDAWNAYEFSTLLTNGYPITGWLKLTYSSNTFNIVESKSLKLYLNSYNMARLISKREDIWKITSKIGSDLSEVVGGKVNVNIRTDDHIPLYPPIYRDKKYLNLEDICEVEKLTFDAYRESPDILEVMPVEEIPGPFYFTTNALRSNCRVTNQPDWGDVYIFLEGDKIVSPESLLKYIVSMRLENHFHEEICECIYTRLWRALEPKNLMVACLYTRRGGIDINPVRASDHSLLHFNAPIADPSIFCQKTMRQ